MRRPFDTGPPPSAPAADSYAQQPTTVSVGPYSLITRVAGALSRQAATLSPARASPPTTNANVRPGATAPGCSASSGRWAGVSLTRLKGAADSAGSPSAAPRAV